MTENNFILDSQVDLPESGRLGWEAPSNIALVKYWGKHGMQLPANPSISFTLSEAKTTTRLSFRKKKSPSEDLDFEFFFEGKRKLDFEPKIRQFFDRALPYLPYLSDYSWQIDSANSFPHSSGIASSASAMAALSLCLLSLEKLGHPEMDRTYFNQKASFLARLGSGSAARSIEGPLMQWGADPHWREVQICSPLLPKNIFTRYSGLIAIRYCWFIKVKKESAVRRGTD